MWFLGSCNVGAPLMVILLKTNRVGLDNVVSCRELVEIKGNREGNIRKK